MQLQLLGALLERLDGDLLEQRDGVVIELPPADRIELPEEGRGVVVPAPPEVARERVKALVRRRYRLSERPRFVDDRRQLSARHHEHPHIVLAEGASLDRLHHQHAHQQPAIQDGNTQEGSIRIFARLVEVFEARMCGGVSQDLRPELLGDQSGKTFGEPHAHAPDTLRPEADRGREHEADAVGLQEIDGTDVGVEPAFDQVYEVVERLRRIAAVRYEPADLLERPEHRPLVGRRRRRHLISHTHAYLRSLGRPGSGAQQERCLTMRRIAQELRGFWNRSATFLFRQATA